MRRRRVGIISLGCSRNTVDSEKLLADVRREGGIPCAPEKADAVIVNTCGFIQEAKEESIDVICDLIALKKKGRIEKVIVAGCLVQRYAGELKKGFHEVDVFVGLADFKKATDPQARLTPSHYAYLKISEGCANRCSFCVLPSVKGPLKSRTSDDIVQEARMLEQEGVKELIIVGQDITLFGSKEGMQTQARGLVSLMEKILKKTGVPWIRLLYLHPKRMSDRLIDLVQGEKRICPYLDLPLQHINDRILRLMRRPTTKKDIMTLMEKIRRRIPQVALRTSLLVGFPSESEEEFRELADFVKETRFDRLGVFKYSREEETPAYHFRGQVSAKVKEERYGRLMGLQREISKANLRKDVGRVIDVLVDEATSKNVFTGRTRRDAPEVDGNVFLDAKTKLAPGMIVKARIRNSFEYDLIGEVV